MTEDEQLQALCVKLGSSPAQAATMAAQLQKARGASSRRSVASPAKRRWRICLIS